MGELARPSVVAEILQRHGLRLSRSLGQHFLIDGNILQQLLRAADLSPQDTALEIGPGIGTLTEELCGCSGRVVAVEMDRRLLTVLGETVGSRPNLELIEGDAMWVDLQRLFSSGERVKVVSNLPYNVATPLILRLLRELPQAGSMVVTVQRELANRYLAQPGNAAYGGVSAKIHLLAEVKRLANLSPAVFLPPPRVESSIIAIERRRDSLPPEEVNTFFHFLDAAFAKRRKMLVNSLGSGRAPYCQRSQAEKALESAGFPLSTRAEELTCWDLLEVLRSFDSIP